MSTLVRESPARNRFLPAGAAWRTLLVHVQTASAATPRLDAAVDLAEKLGATVLGFAAEVVEPMAAADATGVLLSAILESIDADLAAAKERFEGATKSLDREWLATQDYPVRVAAQLARSADLVIAGGSPLDQRDRWAWCDPAELALQTGRPVLIVPPAGGRLEARRIVVGWKDVREARRAVADSLPILKGADEVLVVEVCRADERAEAANRIRAVIAYLARHGIAARSKVIARAADDAAHHLQSEAEALGADLIVAGAYGHSRLGEWVFGGATAALLRDPRRFLLLSH